MTDSSGDEDFIIAPKPQRLLSSPKARLIITRTPKRTFMSSSSSSTSGGFSPPIPPRPHRGTKAVQLNNSVTKKALQSKQTSKNQTQLYPQEQEDTSFSFVSASEKTVRKPVKTSITSNFLNALATDMTLKRISLNARQTIKSLLEEIEKVHQSTLPNESLHSTDDQSTIPLRTFALLGTKNASTQTDELNTKTNSEAQTEDPGNLQDPQELQLPPNPELISQLNIINTKLDALTTSCQTSSTYATATSRNIPTVKNLFQNQAPRSTIVIRPPDPHQIGKIAENLQKLSPPEKIQITKLKVLPNTIELRTTTEPEKDSLKLFLQSKLPTDIPIEDKQTKVTKLIFFNVPEGLTSNQLDQAIKAKLQFPPNAQLESDCIKTTAAKRDHHEHRTVTLPRKIAFALLQHNYILHGLHKIFFNRHIFIRRCTKCQQLNHHSAAQCTAKSYYCSLCGGQHHFTECTAKQECCINCEEFNENVKSRCKGPDDPLLQQIVPLKHSAASNNCPSYKFLFNQRAKELLRQP